MKKILPILAVLFATTAKSQTSTEFWFGVPDFDATLADIPLRLVICSNQAAAFTIEVPANGAFVPINGTLVANDCQVVDLTPHKALIETMPAHTVVRSGIRVTATVPVSAYFELSNTNATSSDYFSFKGDAALGTFFMIPAQNRWFADSTFSTDLRHGFVITATTNNTKVQITPINDLVGHAANVPFTINLNQGESYAAIGRFKSAAKHLAGSEVISDQPIVVTVYTDGARNNTYGSCRDLTGDQIVPVAAVDLEYIAAQGKMGTYDSRYSCSGGSGRPGGGGNSRLTPRPDKLFITAVYGNTSVYQDGNPGPVAVLGRGQVAVLDVDNGSTYVVADAPVYAYQISGNGCQLGGALVPPLKCSGMLEQSFWRNTSEDFFILVIVPAGGEHQFRVNGVSALINPNDFSYVPGTNQQWLAASVKMENRGANDVHPNRVSTIVNLQEKFRMAIIHGCANETASFMYMTDFYKVNTGPIYHHGTFN